MKLANVIGQLEKDILKHQRIISNLDKKRSEFTKLSEAFPDAYYNTGAVCLENIWSKITCMRLFRTSRHWNSGKITARFLLGKKQTQDICAINNLKIYTHPFENTIAEVITTYDGVARARKKEMLISNYVALIPENCPKRKSFLKRIKLHLINMITQEKITLHKNSFNYEEMNKLLMLR